MEILSVIVILLVVGVSGYWYWRKAQKQGRPRIPLQDRIDVDPLDLNISARREEDDIPQLTIRASMDVMVEEVPEKFEMPASDMQKAPEEKAKQVPAAEAGKPAPRPVPRGRTDDLFADHQDNDDEEEEVVDARPVEVLTLHIVSKDAHGFRGEFLREAIFAAGFRFGEMEIFHFADGRGKRIFSLLNGIEPGTFDVEAMDELITPAVTMFMQLPPVSDPVPSLEKMLEVAQRLANTLQAEVLDDRKLKLSAVSADRMRERLALSLKS